MASRSWPQRQMVEWQQWLELAQKAGLRIGLWDWDVVANTVTWSDETYRQTGLTRDTFSGRVEDAVARIHPEDRARVEEAIQKVLAGGTDYAAQYRLVRPDGTICWIEAYGVVVRNNSATHMLGMGIDVTNLKKAQQSSRENEEKYLLLLNSTAEGIYGLDLEGRCTFCNPACLRLLGYQAAEDLLGKNMHALVHHTQADETPYSEEDSQIYTAVRAGEASQVAEALQWRADGTSFLATYWSHPMHKAGALVGAVVSFLDISEQRRAEQALRESEEKYRELVENAAYGIYRSDWKGNFLDVNSALVAMLGYSSKAELMTRNLDSDIYENPADRVSILSMFETGGRVDSAEANWKCKDGKTISVQISGGQVRGKDGQVSRFEVIVEDITKRRSLEEQLRQAQKMEAVGLLAGGISHDFNNHLSIILGNADLLLEKIQSGKLQHYAEEIKTATQRAAQLTRQLLAFSRKQVLYPTLLNLNAVVSDVVKILRRLIGEDVQIVIEGETNLASVRADRGQVEQILMNLANNARDVMPNGGKFTVRTENAELGPDDVARYPYVRPGRYVRLSASDTGQGMSAEVRSRAFEPFFTTKPQGRGTGLGLATVYGIVKQSGGYVWISSALGSGTTFDIYLPHVDEAAPPLVDRLEVQREYAKGTETVLLLEDEESLRAVTCEMLTAGGYSVLQAGRGDETIEVAQQYKGPIHLIVSDLVLPDMSGPSAVARVQALHPEAKVLFVSGYAELPVAQTLVAEGANLLLKPVSRSELMRKMDEILHLRIPSAEGVHLDSTTCREMGAPDTALRLHRTNPALEAGSLSR
jgi:two-component system cell cycle sensor histidine kinase/response regulator CckA